MSEQQTIWREIAALINQLPPETRQHYRRAIRRWMHDMGHHIGLVRTSESLIRRMASECPCTDIELLDIIDRAGEKMSILLAEAQALGSDIENDEATHNLP